MNKIIKNQLTIFPLIMNLELLILVYVDGNYEHLEK